MIQQGTVISRSNKRHAPHRQHKHTHHLNNHPGISCTCSGRYNSLALKYTGDVTIGLTVNDKHGSPIYTNTNPGLSPNDTFTISHGLDNKIPFIFERLSAVELNTNCDFPLWEGAFLPNLPYPLQVTAGTSINGDICTSAPSTTAGLSPIPPSVHFKMHNCSHVSQKRSTLAPLHVQNLTLLSSALRERERESLLFEPQFVCTFCFSFQYILGNKTWVHLFFGMFF